MNENKIIIEMSYENGIRHYFRQDDIKTIAEDEHFITLEFVDKHTDIYSKPSWTIKYFMTK